MFGIEGEADIADEMPDVCLCPQADIGRSSGALASIAAEAPPALPELASAPAASHPSFKGSVRPIIRPERCRACS
jgi:hypothetical protein